MSVLIKNIEMPKNCWECPCFREDHVCNLDDEYREVYDDKPDWCPLVELIDKHGRLVDFDKIEWYEVTGTVTVGDRDFGETKFALINIDHFRNLPTVIEAEGEE